VHQILQWLSCSLRPLYLEEVAEIVAFDVDNDSKFDIENRFAEPEEILKICSSLVTSTNTDDHGYKKVDDEETEDEEIYESSSKTRSKTTIVRLAHFSVKEYLTSERIQAGSASFYSIDEKIANSVIAEMSLSCLLQFDRLLVANSAEFSEKFPLAEYAARYWNGHVLVYDRSATRLAMALFLSEEKFRNWKSLHDLDEKFRWVNGSSSKLMGAPLYYAVLTRSFKLVAELIEFNAATSTQTEVCSISLPVNSTDTEVSVARQWPSTGGYINAKGGNLYTALQAASRLGQEDIVNLLIDKGADLNLYGCRSALSDAACSGSKNVVELLLNNGADVHEGIGLDLVGSTEPIRAENDRTQPLQTLPSSEVHEVAEKDGSSTISQRASAAENEEISLKSFVEAVYLRADNQRQTSALFEASTYGHADVVTLLLEKGATVDKVIGAYGATALSAASKNGHEQVVRVLLEKGADVNKTDVNGDSPLHRASITGQKNTVNLLLKHGANVDKSNEFTRTPLHGALIKGYKQIVNLLLKRGANVEKFNEYGRTPLYKASYKGDNQIVGLLLKHGARVNKTDENGRTPLYEASLGGHEQIVNLLLEHGASVDKSDKNGWTPLYIASLNGCEKVVDLLLKHGANVDRTDGIGRTPLHQASSGGHEYIVNLLLKHGASVDKTDWFGRTPLHEASARGNEQIVNLLLKHKASG
jgi:ankyrin repeat protein